MTHRTLRAGGLIGALALLVALTVSAGCGKSRQTVSFSGTITYKGDRIVVGAIYFHSADNQVAMGIINEDGTFTATDVPVGEVRVSLRIKDPGHYDAQLRDSAAALKPRAKGVTSVPANFEDPDSSGLKYTITAETKTLEVKID
jgi:hypothetical protein